MAKIVHAAAIALAEPKTHAGNRATHPPEQDDFQLACEELRSRMGDDEYQAFVLANMSGDAEARLIAERVASEVRQRKGDASRETMPLS